ncbi:MAG: hypothetical protein FD189_1059 [Elusimicrobia bacterium]|nr:MAG: hypothetical protein FD189_1059 [Elusimicrobiota bacterium]
MRLVILGHCPSKKNSRDIFRNRRTGRMFPGKSDALRTYEEKAALLFRQAWGARLPLVGDVKIRAVYHYAGKRPDALGFMETIFDAIQAAGIVADDVQLVPSGMPAIRRIHCVKAQERVEVELATGVSHD